MSFSQHFGLWAKVSATSNESSSDVRTLMIVGTRSDKDWLDLVALASLPPLYRLTKGAPLMLICDDVTTHLDTNSEKFLTQYRPQKVIIIGDDLFSPDITSIIPDALIQRIVGNTLDELTVKISKDFFSYSSSAILINETDYQSALAISPYASYTNTPIFYYQETISETVLKELHRLGVQKIILPNPSEKIVEVLKNFTLSIIPSLEEIIDQTTEYLETVEYVTVTNPLDKEKGNKLSLVAPLFTLFHKGLLIPISYNMTKISIPIESYCLTTERPLGAPLAPMRYWNFDVFEDQLPREDGSTLIIYPVNGTFFKAWLCDLNPFDTAGIYFTSCYLGASLPNSTKIDTIAIDLDWNGKIADNEVFRIINGTITISKALGNFKFADITFEKNDHTVSLFCRPSTWIKGQVILENKSVDFVLSLSLTRQISDPRKNAYSYCSLNYVLLNLDWNNDGRFDGPMEGPYTRGDTFKYENKTYFIDFNFPVAYGHIGELRLFSRDPKDFLPLINSKINGLQNKFLCLVGSENFVPMQYSIEPLVNRNLIWGDYNYSGPNVGSLYPAVGRIDTYDVEDASLVYLRTAAYRQIQSNDPSKKALVLCDHVPPYSIEELKKAGFEVSLMGHKNYSIEKVWRDMRNSDIVLLHVGHAYWPFKYAEPDYKKPPFIIHWMCKSAYKWIGYKRFFHAGAVSIIGTTEYMASPEGGEVELIYTLLNQMLNRNSTIGEAFNIAKLYVLLRMKEHEAYRINRLLTILGSLIFGDPAFRMYSSCEINNAKTEYSDIQFGSLNSTHMLAYIDINASFQNASWWETYIGCWCGTPITKNVSHYRLEGITVSQFSDSVPINPPNESGSAEMHPPTYIFTCPIPEKAKVLNVTLRCMPLTPRIPLDIWEDAWITVLVDLYHGKYLTFTADDTRYVMWDHIIADYDKENKTLIWFSEKVSYRLYFIFSKPSYTLFVNTSPITGLSFTINGTKYTSPQNENFTEGTYIISMPDNVVVNGTIYKFQYWKDGWVNPTRTIILTKDSTLTANYKAMQHYLTIESAYGNPVGQGWYNAGSKAYFRVESPIEYNNGTRRVFVSWSGDSTTSNLNGSIIMDAPKKVVATWKTQYYLKIASQYGNPKGSGWYDEGETATATIESEIGLIPKYVFVGWNGDIVSSSTTVTITMDKPYTLIANWTIDWTPAYFLIGGLIVMSIAAILIVRKTQQAFR